MLLKKLSVCILCVETDERLANCSRIRAAGRQASGGQPPEPPTTVSEEDKAFIDSAASPGALQRHTAWSRYADEVLFVALPRLVGLV